VRCRSYGARKIKAISHIYRAATLRPCARGRQQIALLGQQIVEEVQPEYEHSEVSAIDGRMYKAQGPKWRKSDRQNDIVPVGLRNAV
jgi:hypothetical protein